MKILGEVAELCRYPVSSMGGERLDQAEFRTHGIVGDRSWGVFDADSGEIAAPESWRRWRPLPGLIARLGADMPEISDGGGSWFAAESLAARELLADTLGFKAIIRPFDEKHLPRYQHDPVHLLTTSSMASLAPLLPDPSQVDIRRFRPGLVLDADDQMDGFPDAGLIGKTLCIGSATLKVTSHCERCAFTSLAQGELAFDPSIIQTIARLGGGFGVLCSVLKQGVARTGDAVLLVDRNETVA